MPTTAKLRRKPPNPSSVRSLPIDDLAFVCIAHRSRPSLQLKRRLRELGGKLLFPATASRDRPSPSHRGAVEGHGVKGETENSIKSKLKRGTFAATFLLATLAALELEGVKLEDL
jgi:hypothetical protein